MPAMRRWRFGHAEVFAALFALSFLAARLVPALGIRYRCPVVAIAGIPCFTCGMTRAFVRLAHGDVAGALAASPAGALLAAAAWAFALAALARPLLGFEWPRVPARSARALVVAAALGLLVNWAYLLAAGAPA